MSVARATVTPGSPLAGRTVGQIEQEYGLAVTLHKRADETVVHPQEGATLQDGDSVVLVGPVHGLARLRGVVPNDAGRHPRARPRPPR